MEWLLYLWLHVICHFGTMATKNSLQNLEIHPQHWSKEIFQVSMLSRLIQSGSAIESILVRWLLKNILPLKDRYKFSNQNRIFSIQTRLHLLEIGKEMRRYVAAVHVLIPLSQLWIWRQQQRWIEEPGSIDRQDRCLLSPFRLNKRIPWSGAVLYTIAVLTLNKPLDKPKELQQKEVKWRKCLFSS